MELDVASHDSVDRAIQQIVAENGRLDVVIHSAGHMVFGPAGPLVHEMKAWVACTVLVSAKMSQRKDQYDDIASKQ